MPSAMSPPMSFWDFTLDLYARPGVSAACLALQDRHGADVNIVLWTAWAAAAGQRVGKPELALAEAAARPWREAVIHPLRAARQALKTPASADHPHGAADLRASVKSAELEGERLEQSILAAIELSPDRRPPVELARENLGAYLATLSPPPDPALAGPLLGAFGG